MTAAQTSVAALEMLGNRVWTFPEGGDNKFGEGLNVGCERKFMY